MKKALNWPENYKSGLVIENSTYVRLHKHRLLQLFDN